MAVILMQVVEEEGIPMDRKSYDRVEDCTDCEHSCLQFNGFCHTRHLYCARTSRARKKGRERFEFVLKYKVESGYRCGKFKEE